MALDASELVVASSGSIAVAPVGTTAPTDASGALGSGWIELGYATEDGVTLSASPTIEEFPAWQTRQPVRRELTAQEVQASFGLQQWNADTVALAFGGGTVTEVSPGPPAVYRYDFLADDAPLDERALCVSWQDGEKNYRIVFDRGNVTEAVETNLTRGALAVLPITFKASASPGGGPGYLLTDDPAFAGA